MAPQAGPLVVRPATLDDRPRLRQAIIELHEYERRRQPARLPGEQVATAYLDWMLARATIASGAVLVAESGGAFAGFIAGWIEESDYLAETPDSNRVGSISDICVIPPFRGRRIATQLLEDIEAYLRPAGVTRLRISSLAVNTSARTSYEHAGFVPYEVLYEKLIADEVAAYSHLPARASSLRSTSSPPSQRKRSGWRSR